MSGSIKVKSEFGVGTTFKVNIPIIVIWEKFDFNWDESLFSVNSENPITNYIWSAVSER